MIQISIRAHKQTLEELRELEAVLTDEREVQLDILDSMMKGWSGDTASAYNDGFSRMLQEGLYSRTLEQVKDTISTMDDSLVLIQKYKNDCDNFYTALTDNQSYDSCSHDAGGVLKLDNTMVAKIDTVCDDILSANKGMCNSLREIMKSCRDLVDFGDLWERLDAAEDKVNRIGELRTRIDDYARAVSALDASLAQQYGVYAKDCETEVPSAFVTYGSTHIDNIASCATRPDFESQALSQSATKIPGQELMGVNAPGTMQSADPVNLSTGNFIYDREDLKINGEIPLSFHRYYNSRDTRTGALGRCFLHGYEMGIEVNDDKRVAVRFQDGQIKHFEKRKDGSYIGTDTALETLEDAKDGGYLLTTLEQDRTLFDSHGRIIRQENKNGRGITFTYDSLGRLEQASTDSNSSLFYFYTQDGKLERVSDHTGRTVTLEYTDQMLSKVTLPSGVSYTYAYGENGRITAVENPRRITAVKNTYDDHYRVIHQDFPDGGTMDFDYDDDARTVTMTERNGSIRTSSMMSASEIQKPSMRTGRGKSIHITKETSAPVPLTPWETLPA